MSDRTAIMNMRRINVTGNAGSGKTTVAARLAEALDLELIGLDTVVWKSGWAPTPPEERKQKEAEIAGRPGWVVDGVSETIRCAADTIVFLDCRRWTALRRCLGRNRKYLFKSRPGLPEGCPEILIMPTLLRIIWQFNRRMRPKIMAEFDMFRKTKRIVHIRNDRELETFLEETSEISNERLRHYQEFQYLHYSRTPITGSERALIHHCH